METPAVADVQPKKSKQSPAREDEGGADSGASTSGTAKSETRTKEEPVSEFYQSLLESSYTDDGSELQFKRKIKKKQFVPSSKLFPFFRLGPAKRAGNATKGAGRIGDGFREAVRPNQRLLIAGRQVRRHDGRGVRFTVALVWVDLEQ